MRLQSFVKKVALWAVVSCCLLIGLVSIAHAATFDGHTTYVDISPTNGVYNNNVYTVEATINTMSDHFYTIYGEGANGAWGELSLNLGYNGNINVIGYNDTGTSLLNITTTGLTLDDGQSHVVSWVDNNGDYVLYVDGVFELSGSYNHSSITINNCTIGNLKYHGSYYNFYSGIISDVRLWTVLRTQAQIQNNLTSVLSPQSGLKAYYLLNETTGTSAIDSSGNGYNGTIHALPTNMVFTETPGGGKPPLTVSFTDNSIYADSWLWNFGDGNTSTLQNPSHIYYDLGIYNVSETAHNSNGNSTFTEYVVVANTTWSHMGLVLYPNYGWEGDYLGEPTVMYDTNPQILTNYTHVFKMWYYGGYWNTTMSEGYAESPDGINWTRYNGNPIITNVLFPYIFKYNGVYYNYEITGDFLHLNLYTSNDGVNFTLTNSNILSPASGGWTSLGGSTVWVEDGTWYNILQGQITGVYSSKLFTSPDGVTWTLYSPSTITCNATSSTGSFGAYRIYKGGGIYYTISAWNPTGLAHKYSDIYIFSSTDILHWTLIGPYYQRTTPDEDVDGPLDGGIADPNVIYVNGNTYLFYDACMNWHIDVLEPIKLAINYNKTILPPTIYFGSSVYTTQEHAGNIALPIYLFEASSDDITVYLTTTDGTAIGGTDYVAINNYPVTIPADQTQTNAILSIKDDLDASEGPEDLYVELSYPTGNSTLGDPYRVRVVIVQAGSATSSDLFNYIVACLILMVLGACILCVVVPTLLKSSEQQYGGYAGQQAQNLTAMGVVLIIVVLAGLVVIVGGLLYILI